MSRPALLLSALCIVLACSADPTNRRPGFGGKSRDVERRLGEYLRKHYAEPLALPQVARELDMSVSTLNALLKKYLKQTFLQYLSRIRLDESKTMLRKDQYSIAQVAFESGFASLATFNRRFRQDTGMTPGAYRQRHAG